MTDRPFVKFLADSGDAAGGWDIMIKDDNLMLVARRDNSERTQTCSGLSAWLARVRETGEPGVIWGAADDGGDVLVFIDTSGNAYCVFLDDPSQTGTAHWDTFDDEPPFGMN